MSKNKTIMNKWKLKKTTKWIKVIETMSNLMGERNIVQYKHLFSIFLFVGFQAWYV